MDVLELSGDEVEGYPSDGDDGGRRSDEAEEVNVPDEENAEEGGRRIDPTTSRKIVRNPQPKLDVERLQGPKGIQTIENYFEGFKFYGKGHEKTDLDRIMKRMEHWAHRIFPKYRFDDFIEKMEVLGTKKNVQVLIKKYRMGMLTPQVDIVDQDEEDKTERGDVEMSEPAPIDDFDKLITEQIEKQRQAGDERTSQVNEIPGTSASNVLGSAKSSELSDEIRARIERNKRIAMERKMARAKRLEAERESKMLKEQSQSQTTVKDIEDIAENLKNYKVPSSIHSKTIQNSIAPREIIQDIRKSANRDLARPNEEITRENRDSTNQDRSQHEREIIGETRDSTNQNPQPEEEISREIRESTNQNPQPEEEISREIRESTNQNLPQPEEQIAGSTRESANQNLPEEEEQMDVSAIMEHFDKVCDSPEWEDPCENYRSNVETSDKKPDTVRLEESQSQRKSIEKSKNDPNRLLTREELLMEIDEAMEAIIQKKRRSKNIAE